ncbi:hypothetical protein HYQ44_006447 [Verticillium longisporum]|nr:hypothetical protein HYQ44_006447 [Verticillium longisporum]
MLFDGDELGFHLFQSIDLGFQNGQLDIDVSARLVDKVHVSVSKRCCGLIDLGRESSHLVSHRVNQGLQRLRRSQRWDLKSLDMALGIKHVGLQRRDPLCLFRERIVMLFCPDRLFFFPRRLPVHHSLLESIKPRVDATLLLWLGFHPGMGRWNMGRQLEQFLEPNSCLIVEGGIVVLEFFI